MKTNILSAYFLLFFVIFANAQIKNDDVLFTVEDKPILASEFLKVYNKNLDLIQDESQKNVLEKIKTLIKNK